MNRVTAVASWRSAAPADNELLARIGAETFADTFAADNTPADMAAYLAKWFTPGQLARELADPNRFLLIAEWGPDVVGYAKLHSGERAPGVAAERPIELARIYARKPWHGQGVGGLLMQASLEAAAARDHDVIWLGVWERNARAVAFYRKWGFAIVGAQTFLLGSDAQNDFLMQRPVLMNR